MKIVRLLSLNIWLNVMNFQHLSFEEKSSFEKSSREEPEGRAYTYTDHFIHPECWASSSDLMCNEPFSRVRVEAFHFANCKRQDQSEKLTLRCGADPPHVPRHVRYLAVPALWIQIKPSAITASKPCAPSTTPLNLKTYKHSPTWQVSDWLSWSPSLAPRR